MLFLGLLILMVFIFWRPQDFILPLMGLPLFRILSIGLIPGWCFRILGQKRAHLLDAHQNVLMFTLWFAIALSSLYVRWKSYTVSVTIDWFEFIIIYLLLINFTDSARKLRLLTWVIVMSAALTAWMGIMQHYGRDIAGIGPHADGRIRGVGIFDTNQLAYTMAFCAPLAISLLLSARSFLMRIVMLIAIYLYSACIFFTQSRGGLASLMLVFFFIFLTHSRRKAVKIIGFALTFILLLVFMQYAPRFSSSIDYKTDDSAMGRVDVWADALALLKSSPFFGVGKGQFREYFKLAPHSSYIQIATELGLVGLFIWLCLFYYSIRNLRLVEKHSLQTKDKFISTLSRCLQVSFFAYLSGSFFSGNAYYTTLYILFALTVALQNISGAPALTQRVSFRFKELRSVAFYEITLIVLIHLFVKSSH